jgi:hypothetical protein
MAHAYRNSVPGNLPYPSESSRVTSRLTNNNPPIPLSDGTLVQNSFGADLPYAYFIYPHQVVFTNGSYVAGRTGSAMFTSEAYWIGGLPMTFDRPQNTGCPVEAELAETGWRYCSNDQVASYGWRDHGALTTYYSDRLGLNPIISENGGIITRNLFAIDQGEINDLIQIAGSIGEGYPLLINSSNREDFYQNYFNPNSLNARRFEDIQSVELGDYIFINRPITDSLGHGFLVVGWGEITSCSNALGRFWTYDIPSDPNDGQLFVSFTNANNHLVVPYVVDFSGGIHYAQLQQPRARPFYCAQHHNPRFFRINDSYEFYRFPKTSVAIEASDLFTPMNWNWGGE